MPDSSMFSAVSVALVADAVVDMVPIGQPPSMSESQKRDARIIDRIRMMMGVHGDLCDHAEAVQVSIEHTVVVLRGQLPTQNLKRELASVIRQGGVLLRIDNAIEVLG